MKTKTNLPAHPIINQLRKLMKDKYISQATMALHAEISASQFSKVMKGEIQISLWQVSKIARNLNMTEAEIFTYPDEYVLKSDGQKEPIEATLQIKLRKDKKDQVLKLVFGDNNLEILNK